MYLCCIASHYMVGAIAPSLLDPLLLVLRGLYGLWLVCFAEYRLRYYLLSPADESVRGDGGALDRWFR